MQPGMHNIRTLFMQQTGAPQPLRGHIVHGNRTIVIVEQGYLGFAQDNGQPVLLPPGIHVWTSESLFFVKPAQSVVLLCAPQMMKLGEKVWSAGH